MINKSSEYGWSSIYKGISEICYNIEKASMIQWHTCPQYKRNMLKANVRSGGGIEWLILKDIYNINIATY
jgi:hypothetical protein